MNNNLKTRLYKCNKDKIIYILERLTNEKINTNDDNKIRELLIKFGLDEYFIKDINEL